MPRIVLRPLLRLALRTALPLLALGVSLSCGPGALPGLALNDNAARADTASGLSQPPAGEVPLPNTLIVKACMALEAGELETASDTIRALHALLPGGPEPRILEALVALRREQPALPWSEAYVRVWKTAGRPELASSPYLQGEELPLSAAMDTDTLWQQDLSPEARLVLALAGKSGEAQLRFALQQLSSLEEPGLAIAVHELLSGSNAPEDVQRAVIPAFRERLPALLAAAPEAMNIRLMALMDGTERDQPITAEELSKLEEIAALPEWRTTDLAALYERMRNDLKAAHIDDADALAFQAAVFTLTNDAQVQLQRRTKASATVLLPSERGRLAEVLWRIGSRMANESTILERLVATMLMRKGAELQGNETRLRESNALRDRMRATLQEWKRAAPGSWPLPSLRTALLEANVKDEVGHMEVYLPEP